MEHNERSVLLGLVVDGLPKSKEHFLTSFPLTKTKGPAHPPLRIVVELKVVAYSTLAARSSRCRLVTREICER
jgi:hypothetical protein